MKKYLYSFSVVLLLFVLIYYRVSIRLNNPLNIDEVEEVSHLISFSHLIFTYLPSIPGGAPGQYLIALFVNKIFPNNKFMLAIPGILGNIIIFLSLPYLVKIIYPMNIRKIKILSFYTRICFVLDPVLAYQSIEIRPYSLLPCIWIISVFICNSFIKVKINNMNFKNKIFFFWGYIVLLTIIFIWHYYGFIIFISIFTYNLLIKKNNFHLLKDKLIKFIIVGCSFLISLPIWRYFIPGSFRFNIRTADQIFTGVINYFQNYRTLSSSVTWINNIFILLILFTLSFVFFNVTKIKNVNKFLHQKKLKLCKDITIFLIIFPVITIFMLDVINNYWFLLRQFSFVLLPVYILFGIFFSEIIDVNTLKSKLRI
jgi:hypothetical protein